MEIAYGDGKKPASSFYRLKEGGEYMYGEIFEVVAFSPNRGVQWSATVESTLWSTGEYGVGRGSCPGQPLGLAEIASVSW